MYSVKITPLIEKIFLKLSKKHPKQMDIIVKKLEQVVNAPYHFKPLRGDMKGSRRVHIDKSFVLIYEIDEKEKTVIILDYEHHDKIYDF